MSDKLLGIDVSTWQGEMDWTKAKEAGANFAFVRGGSCNNVTGENYVDNQFFRNASIAPDLMPIGYYWFFRPQHNPTGQADFFANLLNQSDWLMPPVIDVESSGGLSPAKYADAIYAFIIRLTNLTARVPIIYTSSSKWAQVEPRSYWPNYDLWVAHYTTSPEPLLPEAWKEYKFWQYSSLGSGPTYGAKSAAIDLDWFNGSLDDLHKYLNISPSIPKMIRIKNRGKNMVCFDVPGGKGINLSVVDEEVLLGVDESIKDDQERIWYRSGPWWVGAWGVEIVE